MKKVTSFISTFIKTLIKKSLIVLLFGLPFSSVADIFVDRAIVRMSADQTPREDIKVINNGNEVGYVQIEVFEVQNPGTEKEERVKITDPDQLKLIVSPSKLMIPANSQKLVRIVNLDPGSNDERIYRINVTPVLAPLEEENGSIVRVVVAYQLLVIIDPAAPKEELKILRDGKTLTIENTGNTNVLFSDGKQCNKEGNNCFDIAAHRVYPGNTWTIELEKDTPAIFKLTSFNGIREINTQ
ncbi:MAG: fimbria/pilus periplasmic chaperone [Cellvibrionaceae bacterium]